MLRRFFAVPPTIVAILAETEPKRHTVPWQALQRKRDLPHGARVLVRVVLDHTVVDKVSDADAGYDEELVHAGKTTRIARGAHSDRYVGTTEDARPTPKPPMTRPT